MEKLTLCEKCLTGVFRPLSLGMMYRSRRCRSSTQILCKRKQRKYNPKVRPQWEFGAAHRFMRGLDVQQERYGPLVDRPDYSFLDGRPTPLTPQQIQEKMVRKDIATKVMTGLNKMDSIKHFAQEKSKQITEDKQTHEFPLKAKS